MISIAKPDIGKDEENAVIKTLRSGGLAQGEMVSKFEDAFARYIGTKYAVAVSSGTAALHLSLLALNIDANDEVITTPFSFIASANAIVFTGAKPVFVDIDPQTLTIDPKKIEERITKKTKAIIPVHLFGLPANMQKIISLARKYKIKVVEDACQAHGASINNKLVGNLGDTGCFSFYPTKNMTTGEGGIVTTNSKQLSNTLKLLRSHGMPKRYFHTILGYNLRMTDIGASIGLVQLKKLNRFNKIRLKNAHLYSKYLTKIKGITIPFIPETYSHVFHQYTIRINSDYHKSRKRLIHDLRNNNIASEIFYPIPIHNQKLYKNFGYKESFVHAELAAKEVLSLPVHPKITREEILRVISVLQ